MHDPSPRISARLPVGACSNETVSELPQGLKLGLIGRSIHGVGERRQQLHEWSKTRPRNVRVLARPLRIAPHRSWL